MKCLKPRDFDGAVEVGFERAGVSIFQWSPSHGAPQNARRVRTVKTRSAPRKTLELEMVRAGPLSRVAVRPFLITYWLDDLVLEVRVVDVQRVRY